MQQELKDKEAYLEQCYLRLERGEPPSDEIEMEWQKQVRQEWLRMKEAEQRQTVSLKHIAEKSRTYLATAGLATSLTCFVKNFSKYHTLLAKPFCSQENSVKTPLFQNLFAGE